MAIPSAIADGDSMPAPPTESNPVFPLPIVPALSLVGSKAFAAELSLTAVGLVFILGFGLTGLPNGENSSSSSSSGSKPDLL
jgi:hypothetical protein